jgi:hypothetical protein
MSPRPALFRQVDVARAIRAAKAAGLEISRIEIDAQGQLVIINSVGHVPAVAAEPVVPGPSDYERWKAKRIENPK